MLRSKVTDDGYIRELLSEHLQINPYGSFVLLLPQNHPIINFKNVKNYTSMDELKRIKKFFNSECTNLLLH